MQEMIEEVGCWGIPEVIFAIAAIECLDPIF